LDVKPPRKLNYCFKLISLWTCA